MRIRYGASLGCLRESARIDLFFFMSQPDPSSAHLTRRVLVRVQTCVAWEERYRRLETEMKRVSQPELSKTMALRIFRLCLGIDGAVLSWTGRRWTD